jgi:hypothetical protein
MKSTGFKIILIAGIALLGAVGGYWLGHRSALAKAADARPASAGSLRAILVSGPSGQAMDWRSLLNSTGQLEPDLLAAWARSLSPEQIAAALQSLKGQPANLRRNDLLGALYNAWAGRDPKGFLVGSGDIAVPRLREGGIDEALKTWAAQDPKAALQWIKDNPGTASTAATDERYAAAIAGYANTDPAGALAAVNSLDDENVHDRQMKSAATKALADALADQGGFAQASAFFSQLPAGSTRDDAFSQLATRWTEIAPQDAATWVEGLNGDPQLQSAIGAQVAKAWAENDPSAAATWAAKMDAQDEQSGADNPTPTGQLLATAIQSWTNYDLDPAGAFLNLLPASAAKDPAVAIFALRSSQEDPAGAFQWVNSISNDQMRLGMTVNVALEWMRQDPAGYNQFLNTSTTLSDQQKVMLAGIPPDTLQSLAQLNTALGGGDAMQSVMENAILNGKGLVGERGNAPIPAAPPIPANSPGGANFNPADFAPAPDSTAPEPTPPANGGN